MFILAINELAVELWLSTFHIFSLPSHFRFVECQKMSYTYSVHFLVSKNFLHLLPVHFQVLLDFPGRLAGIVTTIVFLQTILSTTLYSTHRVLAERTQGMAVS